MAAYEGDLAKLRRYCDAGGDLEKRDTYRATPLLLAAEKVMGVEVDYLSPKDATTNFSSLMSFLCRRASTHRALFVANMLSQFLFLRRPTVRWSTLIRGGGAKQAPNEVKTEKDAKPENKDCTKD